MKTATNRTTQRSVSRFIEVGRWVVVVLIIGNLAVNLALSIIREDQPPQAFVAQVVEAAACTIMLWNPALGLLLGIVPLAMTLAWGALDAEGLFIVLSTGIVAIKGRPWQIGVYLALGIGFAWLRWGTSVPDVTVYIVTMLGAMLAGLTLRYLLAKMRQGEARLEVLAQDAADIRSAERVHLAGELRSAVSEKLVQAWQAQQVSTDSDVAGLQASLEAVRLACVDAVTRVRALVGMLREDPVASGSDESIAYPTADEVIRKTTAALASLGLRVDFQADEALNDHNLVTQLTVIRLFDWLRESAPVLRPRTITILASGAAGMHIDITMTRAQDLTADDRLALERLIERVKALGGSLRVQASSNQHHLVLTLGDQLSESEQDSPDAGWRRLFLRGLYWLPAALLITMAVYTGMSQDFGWPLTWAVLAYVSVLLMHWRPLVGAVPAIASIIGMVLTPQITPVAMVVVVLAGTWEASRLRNRRWILALGGIALAGMLTLGIIGGNWNIELGIALAVLFFGLIGSVTIRQFQVVQIAQTERTRVLIEAVDRASVEERNLLARELHDVLAHHLSVILLQCMAYGESEDIAELTMVMGRIGKSLKSAEDELALLTSVMSNGESDTQAALVRPTSVAALLLETLQGEGFQAYIEIDPAADELPAITQRTLTRVMQEGVTNMLRYAKRGGQCTITLTAESEEVNLRVTSELPDNRRGSQLSLGLGLAGIRERVDLSGGTFEAGPQQGLWVVAIALPSGDREAESLGGVSAYTLV